MVFESPDFFNRRFIDESIDGLSSMKSGGLVRECEKKDVVVFDSHADDCTFSSEKVQKVHERLGKLL